MWQRYGYLLVSPARGVAADRASRVWRYSGVSAEQVWPVVDEAYWADPGDIPMDVRTAYGEIKRDSSDFLFLGVTRSSSVLWRIGAFIEASGTGADALGVEIDTEELLQPCDHLDLSWLGYEPYARGEWGLLSLLESSPALAHWLNHLNNYGLLESPRSCLAFATDYRTTMGKPGGPEPIADSAPIDVLHVGLGPRIAAERS